MGRDPPRRDLQFRLPSRRQRAPGRPHHPPPPRRGLPLPLDPTRARPDHDSRLAQGRRMRIARGMLHVPRKLAYSPLPVQAREGQTAEVLGCDRAIPPATCSRFPPPRSPGGGAAIGRGSCSPTCSPPSAPTRGGRRAWPNLELPPTAVPFM